MSPRVRQFVRERAHEICEYCFIAQPREPLSFHIEHILPRQHGGRSVKNNLALACHYCNLNKGPNLAGIDSVSKQLVRLFNPRKDLWNKHFTLKNGHVFGLTATGRVTIRILKMNQIHRKELRK